MKFEPGKTYKTKSERKAYCIGENPLASVHSRWVFSTESGSVFAVSAKGKWRIDGLEDPWDIIGEWQEPVTVTRWWFAYERPNGTRGEAWFSKRKTAENDRRDLASIREYRVGPIEQITTVVP